MGFQETFNERVIPAANRAFGVEVTLKHGNATTDPFTATWSNAVYEVVDSDNALMQFTGRDWTFVIEDATADSEVFEPRAGDRIVCTENGTDTAWDILPVGGLPAVELMPGGFRWKVRTKRVA